MNEHKQKLIFNEMKPEIYVYEIDIRVGIQKNYCILYSHTLMTIISQGKKITYIGSCTESACTDGAPGFSDMAPGFGTVAQIPFKSIAV